MRSPDKALPAVDRSKLPTPSALLEALEIAYTRRAAWLLCRCPFHKGGQERNPSLSMHSTKGHYCCYACGEKGGDVIAFHRAVTGAGFIETMKVLGALHA